MIVNRERSGGGEAGIRRCKLLYTERINRRSYCIAQRTVFNILDKVFLCTLLMQHACIALKHWQNEFHSHWENEEKWKLRRLNDLLVLWLMKVPSTLLPQSLWGHSHLPHFLSYLLLVSLLYLIQDSQLNTAFFREYFFPDHHKVTSLYPFILLYSSSKSLIFQEKSHPLCVYSCIDPLSPLVSSVRLRTLYFAHSHVPKI